MSIIFISNCCTKYSFCYYYALYCIRKKICFKNFMKVNVHITCLSVKTSGILNSPYSAVLFLLWNQHLTLQPTEQQQQLTTAFGRI